jgi:two-component system, NtrC family, sensor histidine kinase HydH
MPNNDISCAGLQVALEMPLMVRRLRGGGRDRGPGHVLGARLLSAWRIFRRVSVLSYNGLGVGCLARPSHPGIAMNRKILIQVTAPTVIISGLLFVACVVSAWYISRLQGDVARIQTQEVVTLQAAQELEIRVRQLRFHSFLNLVDPTHPSTARIFEVQRQFEDALERVRNVAINDEERAYVRAIAEGYDRYKKELAQLAPERIHAGPEMDLHKFSLEHPVKYIDDPCDKLLQVSNAEISNTADEAERISHLVTIAMIGMGLVGPVSGLVAGYGIARGLSQTIYQLRVRVHDVAQRLDQSVGSLTVPAEGDLHSLDAQLQEIVHRVEEVMESWQRERREMLRAEQLSAVGQLAASVAHEVRNPLTGVKLLIDAALLPNKPRPLRAEDLQVIRDEVARVQETVKDFLDFARPPVPQCTTCDLRDVVKQAADLVRARARQQQVAVELTCDDEPVLAHVDRGLLCTVFVNLFINSLDAMTGGGKLAATVHERPGAGAQMEILDTGPGIAAEILGRLFTPFASTKATGTGLGLSISRRIIEQHGGTITGGNRPEGGARFSISLPLAEGGQASCPRS